MESVEDVDALQLDNPDKVAYLTQTTLSLDETTHIVARLQQRFPNITGPKTQDICYATENRQMAVKGVSEFCELMLVRRVVEQFEFQAAGGSREQFRRAQLSGERLERGRSGLAAGASRTSV